MNIVELKDKYILAMFDIPSPDQWNLKYEIIYVFPLDSKIFEEMLSLDDPELYLTERQKKLKQKPKIHFYDMLGTKKNYEKIPIEIRNRLNNILNNSTAFNNFELTISNIKVRDKKERRQKIEDLRTTGIPPIPESVGKVDFWTRLTSDQKKHNKKVEAGEPGHPPLLKQYPLMKNKPFKPDGRLLRVRWKVSEKLFTSSDSIKNPKWIKRKKQMKLNQNLKMPTTTKEFISIPSAFRSARAVLNKSLKKVFNRVQDSVYYLSVKDTYAPNARDSHGNPIYDDSKPRAEFSWDIQKEEFVGKIGNTPAIRLPGDKGAKQFEELFFENMLPLFVLTLDYMRNSDGTFKRKYLYGYNKLIHQSISDWLAITRNSAPSPKEFEEVSLTVNRKVLNEDPDLFLDFLEGENEINEKFDDYALKDYVSSGRGHLKNWIEKREELYLKRIDTGYNFADIINDGNLDDYIEYYNKVITVFNKRQGANKPLIVSMFPKKGDTEEVREEKRKIARALLAKKGWYYTIPNEDYSMEVKFAENKTIRERRKEIEYKLYQIREKFEEEEKLPVNVYREVILKEEFEDLAKAKDFNTLINYYKRIILEPEYFSRPEQYKKWLEQLIPPPMPTEAEIKRDNARSIKEKKEKEEKELAHITKIINAIHDINEFKKVLSRDDVEGS